MLFHKSHILSYNKLNTNWPTYQEKNFNNSLIR